MEVTLDTWMVSDTHFRHKNIIKYCNRPMGHDTLMANNWMQVVKLDDTVLHLGDLMVWWPGLEQEQAALIAQSLPGEKYMLRGNHDKLTDEEFKLFTGFTVVPEFIQMIGQTRVLFSHYPDLERIGQWDLNVHGHIHNNDYHDEFKGLHAKYINISVEVMDYKPKRLREVLNV
jgi:calcineurin-like phosphoesterase family protein